MNHETTLITGASSGIGLHLAREFAKNGHPLVIVAPVEAELQKIANELRQEFGVSVDVVAKDLRKENAAEEIAGALTGKDIEILVNNAGHGQKGNAWEIPLEDDLSMVRLNIEGLLRLTKLFLPPMVRRGRGRILNTASIAGFQPGPGYAVYAATKAFVLSYSESIATELQETGVTATALCPGPTDTDFAPKADMQDTRAFQQAHVMPPQDVAADGYKAVMKGERVIVSGVSNKAMTFMRRFLPESAQAKIQEKFTEEAPPEKQNRERGDIEKQG